MIHLLCFTHLTFLLSCIARYDVNSINNASDSFNLFDSWDSRQDESDLFKRCMESLHNPTSTNLYMKGYVNHSMSLEVINNDLPVIDCHLVLMNL